MPYVTIQIETGTREKLRTAQNIAAGLVPEQPRPTMSDVVAAALAVALGHPDEMTAAIKAATA